MSNGLFLIAALACLLMSLIVETLTIYITRSSFSLHLTWVRLRREWVDYYKQLNNIKHGRCCFSFPFLFWMRSFHLYSPSHPLSHLFLSVLLDKSPRRGHSNPLMRSQLCAHSQCKKKIPRNLWDLPSHSSNRGSCEQQEIQCCPAEKDIDVVRRTGNVVVGLLIEL